MTKFSKLSKCASAPPPTPPHESQRTAITRPEKPWSRGPGSGEMRSEGMRIKPPPLPPSLGSTSKFFNSEPGAFRHLSGSAPSAALSVSKQYCTTSKTATDTLTPVTRREWEWRRRVRFFRCECVRRVNARSLFVHATEVVLVFLYGCTYLCVRRSVKEKKIYGDVGMEFQFLARRHGQFYQQSLHRLSARLSVSIKAHSCLRDNPQFH